MQTLHPKPLRTFGFFALASINDVLLHLCHYFLYTRITSNSIIFAGEYGYGFKGMPFDRVFPGFAIQSGGISSGHGALAFGTSLGRGLMIGASGVIAGTAIAATGGLASAPAIVGGVAALVGASTTVGTTKTDAVGKSIYGGTFDDENFTLKHSELVLR